MNEFGAIDSVALEHTLARAPEGDLWLTLDAPLVATEALFSHPDAQVFWSGSAPPAAIEETPAASVPAPSVAGSVYGEAAVGFGVQQRFAATGSNRVQQLLEQVQPVLARLQELPILGAPRARPRVFGALSFQPGRAERAPWDGFGDAQFILPRLLYCRTHSHATLSVVVAQQHRTQQHREQVGEALQAALSLRAELAQISRVSTGTIPADAGTSGGSKQAWQALVGEALERIASGGYEKLVVARRTELQFHQELSAAATLLALAEQHPQTTRFAVRQGQRTFLGATPERLLLKRGLEFATEAVAGTFRLQDSAFSAELLRSPKEHEEHRPVVEAILTRLGPYAARLEHSAEPQLRELRQLMHLCTPIHGTLRQPEHVLRLVHAMHPTPAVGGVPTGPALDWIAAHEQDERGWYAGPVGWFDAAGDGEFVVALRSGVLSGSSAYLFAGAGIVRGSDPQSEFEETELKLAALRSALRVAGTTP